jgi:hypothetical protein
VPDGWGSFQKEGSSGTFTWDPNVGATSAGSARAAGVSYGCFSQGYDVELGQRYALRAVRRLEGYGIAHINVRWQTPPPAPKFILERLDPLIYCAGPRKLRCELVGAFQVPEGAGRMIVLLAFSDQRTRSDVAWFDDVELCALP